MNELIIVGPFRTGATSVRDSFKDCVNVRASKVYNYDNLPETVDGIIMIYRNPIDLYVSAFFADCTKPEYPYYFGTRKDVLKAPIRKLIAHFWKFPWKTYEWLNYETHVKHLQTLFGVDKNELVNFGLDANLKEKICVGSRNGKFVVVLLLRTESLDQSLSTLNRTFGVEITSLPRNHCQRAWCKEKYIEFLANFRQSQALKN